MYANPRAISLDRVIENELRIASQIFSLISLEEKFNALMIICVTLQCHLTQQNPCLSNHNFKCVTTATMFAID